MVTESFMLAPQEEWNIDQLQRRMSPQELYAGLARAIPEPVFITDLEQRIVYATERAAALFRTERAEDLIGRKSTEFVTPEGIEFFRIKVAQTIASGHSGVFEERLLRFDGSAFDAELSGALLRDASGGPAGLIGVVRDITIQKRAERELQDWNHRLEERVRERTAALEEANRRLREELERRREAEARAALERDRAERASQIKSRFVAHMSHEIRTPLHGILGLAEHLRRDENDPTRAKYLGMIRDSGRLLLQLLSDALDLARIESDAVQPEERPCRLAGELQSLLGPYLLQAQERGLEFSVDFQGIAGRTLRCDPRRIGQILLNLVSNALRHTSGGAIAIEAELRPDPRTASATDRFLLCLRVADTGPGVPLEERVRIFEPFVQLGGPGESGAGLGLSIAARLAALLKGRLRLESPSARFPLEAERSGGPGADFTLELPVIEETGPDDAPDFAAIPPAYTGDRPPRILVAEDNATSQVLMRIMLEQLGCDFEVVADGHAAVELGTKGAYDLILMDMVMPRLDGVEAARQLRNRGVTAPILAISASALDEDRERCLAAGMNGVLTKPASLPQLHAEIQRYAAPDSRS